MGRFEMDTNVDGSKLGNSVAPRGVCPACLSPIARKDLKVAKPFECPHCHQIVRTDKVFRTLLYLACYGIPTVFVFSFGGSGRTFLANAVIWLILEFLIGMSYIYVATSIYSPRFELFLEKDNEIQTLNLKK